MTQTADKLADAAAAAGIDAELLGRMRRAGLNLVHVEWIAKAGLDLASLADAFKTYGPSLVVLVNALYVRAKK